jgi:membrane protein required for colicin V production
MPIIDIIIILALVVSVVVGFVRGFIKESISIATLVVAVWAALYFGPSVGGISESWLTSAELRVWFGRALVFTVVLVIGGLLGWGISRLVRLSVMNGVDRLMGSLFGAVRGVLLVALFVLGGQFAGFDNDEWWLQSRMLPYFEVAADWIKVMAPKGYDIIIPDETSPSVPLNLPVEL